MKKRRPAPSPQKLTDKVKKTLRAAGEKRRKERGGRVILPEDEQDLKKYAHLFSHGNTNWLLRAKDGREKIFKDPQLLLTESIGYFKFIIDNPMFTKKDWRTDRGKLKMVEIPLTSVFTLHGLCNHLGVSTMFFDAFINQLKKDDPLRNDFICVINYIKHTIYENKFTGASDGTFNARLISYDLGIVKNENNMAASGMIINVNTSKDSTLLEDVKKKLDDIDKSLT